MADGTAALLLGKRRNDRTSATGPGRRAAGTGPLAVVAAVFTVAQLLLVRPVLGLGWDEVVYVSQVTSHHPAAFFSAPRSRGVSLLVAPGASCSPSTAQLRRCLALRPGQALHAAQRAGRRPV